MHMQLKLEVGKTYRRRDGVVVTISKVNRHPRFPFESNEGHTYNSVGANDLTWQPVDLIAEVGDITDAKISKTTRVIGGKEASCVCTNVAGHGRASVIVSALLRGSAWVECTPYPEDMYQITVKTDRRQSLSFLLE
jgi:hypothetical protein